MDLKELYTVLHLLRYNFHYSNDTIDSMLPWELQIELDMIHSTIQKEAAAKNG
jgi:hypothetical protein